jgi:hypothetical protein
MLKAFLSKFILYIYQNINDGIGKPYEKLNKKRLQENMLKVIICPNLKGVFYLKGEKTF